MKTFVRIMRLVLTILIVCLLNELFVFGQDLYLTNHKGIEFSSKPSLSQRMQGVRKIYFFYPRSSAQNDRYIYQNFKVYLQRLGMTVEDRAISYKQVDASQGTVSAYILSCTEDVSEYVKEVNSLAVILNIGHMYGQYIGERMTAVFNFFDFINRYDWQVQMEPARRAEQFISQCQSSICSSYTYNSSYAYHPPYITSNYTQNMLRSYVDKGEYTAIEGIYEGDDYTLGVKKGTDGKYYLIYHSSKQGADGWRDGYIKAVLRETATSGVYRATWYGRYFLQMDSKIIFEKGMFTVYDEYNDKELYLKMYPTGQMESESTSSVGEWSGTGFALNNGYIITNHHVIDGAKSISVYGIKGQMNNGLKAEVVATDKTNDLAIIKITDYSFNGFGSIPYAVKNRTLDVGEDVWVLGYPLTQYLGNEIKLTNGIVSSKSGYQGDVGTYQISAPVQPGNSGGPMFDSKGNIVGVVNAGVPGAENVGYAIKTSYLYNLADSYSISSSIPANNSISSLALPDKVKRVKDYVFLLMCSSKAESSSPSTSSNAISSSTKTTGISSTASSSSSNFTGAEMSLSRSSLVLDVGQSHTLYAYNYGSSVKWESSNTNVATVSSTGVVTAVGVGSTLIWAIGEQMKFCTITVKENPNNSTSSANSVSSSSSYTSGSSTRNSGSSSTSSGSSNTTTGSEMSLSRSSLVLDVGQSHTLYAYNYGSSVKWESSNTNVATVSSTGVVTAVGVGSTLIWAIGEQMKFCTITVKENPNNK